VLVVDDEPQIVRALHINLRARGYDVNVATDGASALAEAGKHPPDLVVLDLGLPDMEGAEVIRGLRGWCSAPIVVLSGRTGSADKIEALDAGADDYVTKPFNVEELFARLRAVARRVQTGDDAPIIELGRHTIDRAARQVRGIEGEVRLTPTEWQLLDVLLRNPGKLVTKRQLLTEVWGPAFVDESNYLRVHMTHLRRKLEDEPGHPRHLLTEPGMGYRYAP
jgi:two-component system KDP operon response regulator KdpE